MRRTMAMLLAVVGLGALAPAGVAGKDNAVKLKRIGYGITADGSLVRFDAGNTSRARQIGTITGLAAGERLVGIDISPYVGALHGLGDKSSLYEIDMGSARAVRKASLVTESGDAVTLRGARFAIDFNPASDRLRVTSDTGQNLRINVDTGVTSVDRALAYAAGDRNAGATPAITGAAYSNNDSDSLVTPPLVPAGRVATGTTLYSIDAARGSLVTQEPPNEGTLQTVRRLRPRAGTPSGFDIFSPTDSAGNTVRNVGYAAFRRGGRARLYKVNLRTGRTTRVKGNGRAFRAVQDIAIVP